MNDNKTDVAISMEDFEEEKERASMALTTEQLLERVGQDKLKNALVAGFDERGSFKFYANFDEPTAPLFLLEVFKTMLIEKSLRTMYQLEVPEGPTAQ